MDTDPISIPYATARDLAAEIAALEEALGRIRAAATSPGAEAELVDAAAAVIRSTLRSLPDTDPARDLKILWRRFGAIGLLPLTDDGPDLRTRLRQLDAALGLLGEMRFVTASIAVPAQVNRWLDQARPGYTLPFNDLFEEELPDPASRRRLLEALALAPDRLPGGLVDLRRGVILRHHRDRLGLWASVAVFGAAVALATSAAAGVAHVPDPGWPLVPADSGASLSSWLALLAGVVVHGAVDAVKRDDSGALVPPVAPVDVVRYLDARLGPLLIGLILALVAHTGFAVVAGRAHLTPLNGFLLGYGLDSAVGLVTTALELRSSRQLTDLGKLVNR